METISSRFITACHDGDYLIAESLLSSSLSSGQIGRAFFGCCANGHTEVAQLLILEFEDIIDINSEYGHKALIAAVSTGNSELVSMIVDNYGDHISDAVLTHLLNQTRKPVLSMH